MRQRAVHDQAEDGPRKRGRVNGDGGRVGGSGAVHDVVGGGTRQPGRAGRGKKCASAWPYTTRRKGAR